MTASPALLPIPSTDLIANVFDSLPLPAFVVDHDFNIIEFNLAGAKLLDRMPFAVLRLRGGEQLQCIHSTESTGDGAAGVCQDCFGKNFVREVFSSAQTGRSTARLRLTDNGRAEDVNFLITVAPISDESEPMALLILDDASEVSVLLHAINPATAASSSPGSKGPAKARVRKTGNS